MSNSVFRAFERQYHKARNVYSLLRKDGDFELKIEQHENKTIQSQNSVPNEELTVRFIVLMEPLLNPQSRIYFRNVWSLLYKQFSKEIDEIATGINEQLEIIADKLNKGHLLIEINNEELSAEKIYRVLSDGDFFARDKDARNYLMQLREMPVVGPLFWHQFNAYNVDGFSLVSSIFGVLKTIKSTKKYSILYPEATPTAILCIYCLSTTGIFDSEEHILPEAIGNDVLILPKGYVCKKCNNNVLANLDEYFVHFPPIELLKVQFVPYSKSGKLPEANFQNIKFEKTSPLNIKVTIKDKTGLPKNLKPLGHDWHSFSLQIRSKKVNFRHLARALYKFGLGMVALEKGVADACNSKYDLARGFIIDNKDFPNNLLMQTVCKPQPEIKIGNAEDILGGTTYEINIFGLVFLLNLEPEPRLELTNELKQHGFDSYSLFESGER